MRKVQPENPLWRKAVGNGRIEVQAVLQRHKDRPLTFVIVLATRSGTKYEIGRISQDKSCKDCLNFDLLRKKGVNPDSMRFVSVVKDLDDWIVARMIMDE